MTQSSAKFYGIRRRFMSLALCLVMIITLTPVSLRAQADDTFEYNGRNASSYSGQASVLVTATSLDLTNSNVKAFTDAAKDSVNSLKFSGSVAVIGEGVFEDFANLNTVDFSQAVNLKIIQVRAFYNSGLSASVPLSGGSAPVTGSLYLPSGLSYMGELAFGGTDYAKYVLQEDSYRQNKSFTTSTDGVLYNDKTSEYGSQTRGNIPADYYATGGTIVAFPPHRTGSYKVPDGVSCIGDYAFEESELESVEFPLSVTSVGKKAFKNSKLNSVKFDGVSDSQSTSDEMSRVNIGEGAFYQDPERESNWEYDGDHKKSQWLGITDVTISQSTADASNDYLVKEDETACFTPYTASTETDPEKGASINVVPDVQVLGVQDTWSRENSVRFTWADSNFFTIDNLYLDGNIQVPVSPGSTSSDQVTLGENGEYTLTVLYHGQSGSPSSTLMKFRADHLDNTPPGDVTYSVVDDICYLHSYDLQSGLEQIKYILNDGNTETYKDQISLPAGRNRLEAWAIDKVSLESEHKVFYVNVGSNVHEITVEPISMALNQYTTKKLSVTFADSDVIDQSLTYSSSDTSVAVVDPDGYVTGMNVGYAVITVISASGYSDKCAVVVTGDPTASKQLTVYKGQSRTLKVNDLREDYDVDYSSDDTSVCTVNSEGVIKGKSAGDATVITTVDTGVRVYTLETEVTVEKPSVKITRKTGSLKVGRTFKARARKKGLTDSIRWTSSNRKVATVNRTSGKIRAQGKGTTTITARCGSYKAKFKLKVRS